MIDHEYLLKASSILILLLTIEVRTIFGFSLCIILLHFIRGTQDVVSRQVSKNVEDIIANTEK